MPVLHRPDLPHVVTVTTIAAVLAIALTCFSHRQPAIIDSWRPAHNHHRLARWPHTTKRPSPSGASTRSPRCSALRLPHRGRRTPLS